MERTLTQSEITNMLKLKFDNAIWKCMFIERGEYSENLRRIIQSSKEQYKCTTRYGHGFQFTDAFGDNMSNVSGYFICRK